MEPKIISRDKISVRCVSKHFHHRKNCMTAQKMFFATMFKNILIWKDNNKTCHLLITVLPFD